MCDSCGCSMPAARTINLDHPLLASNQAAAEHNREHLDARRILAVNIMGAPGAGKTALLEATIARWSRPETIAVIEGDQATRRDSDRIRAAGARALQVETGLGCHLDALQIHRAIHDLDPPAGSIVFVENVGNLVCPALFDLGERVRVVMTAPTEGADKPLKYPPMFRAADIVVLNKCDLLPHVPFDLGQWAEFVHSVNSRARIILTSALTGEGIDEWIWELARRRDEPSAEGAR
jgi:hydrogenase nickel incorporation protein HypB